MHTLTLTFAWWWIPTATTVIALAWAWLFTRKVGNDVFSMMISGFFYVIALGSSLIVWIIAALLK